ncbi:MAG: hypothetical protein ACLQJR_24560 [Stellaceae bacterium]
MSTSGISTSNLPLQRQQALQSPARRLQQAARHQAQLQANGLPKSAMNPSNTAKTGRSMAGSASTRLLNLHL